MEATLYITTEFHFINSPDPKDNFLCDLALRSGSEVIVTQKKALINFKTSPVNIPDLKWFKESFPVPP